MKRTVFLGMILGSLWNACATMPQEKTDEFLTRSVKRALYDRDDVNLLHVEVVVKKGVAYLDGEVEAVTQKVQAEQTANRVGGVVKVVNKLQVLP